MNRLAILLCLAVTCLACREDARSQETPDTSSVVVPAAPEQPRDLDEAISRSRETAITRAVRAAAPAVVSINVIEVQRVRVRDPFADFFSDPWFEQFFGRRRTREYEQLVKGLGSGFVTSPDGYIVTNDHVAGHASKITVSFTNGETMEARLVGTDEATDLSLLKVDAADPLSYLPLSESGAPIAGEWAIALGNPFGLFQAAEPTVTVGVVSAVDRDFSVREGRIYRDMIQTDASINQGNSGGPLINARGEVIGVNTAIVQSGGGGSIGLGFAVPVEKVARIVAELKENGYVDRSYYTGLQGIDVDARIARALGLENPTGVFVRDIDPGSPADRAGFRIYDVIVGIDGEAVYNRNDFVARLYDFRPGDQLGFEIVRDGERQSLSMRIGRSPN